MNEPYEKYLSLGIVHFMIFPETNKGEGPILETVGKIATDVDFQAIEISWIKNDEMRAKVRDLLVRTHLAVGYGVHPRILSRKLNLNDLDAQIRRNAIEEIKQAIDEAAFIKATSVVVLSGKTPPNPEDRTAAKDKLTESLKELSDYAGERNLNLILETFDSVSYGKNCLIGPTREAAEIAQKVNKRNFGLLVDLSHMPLIGESAETMIREASPYLMHVHIGNCVKKDEQHPAYGDEHPGFGISGGENDVPELTGFLRQLFKVGFLGKKDTRPVVSFEVKPQPGESPELLIADSKRVFRRAWADLDL
jgi:sugar phosphate isomerase/epimerase